MKLTIGMALLLGLSGCSQETAQAPQAQVTAQAAAKPAFDVCSGTGAVYSQRRRVCERTLGGEVWDEVFPDTLVSRYGRCPAGFYIHPGFPNYCMDAAVIAQWRANNAPVTYAQPMPVAPLRSDEARALNELVEVQRGIRTDARSAASRRPVE